MPESRAYTLQPRDKSLSSQKKKVAGADDSPPREHFRTMADSKMKHSYSLTSLSSRFLHGASSNNGSGTSGGGGGIGQQTNGHHAHNSFTNGHHGSTTSNGNGNSMLLNGKDCSELDGSDDYGFLSYNTSRGERDGSSKLSGPTSSKSLTSSIHNNNNHSNANSNSGSFYSTATYGRLKQQQQQQLHHPQCQHHQNNNVVGRQSKLKNGSVAPICACDCHLTMGNTGNNSVVSSSSTGNNISNNGATSNNNGLSTIGSRTSSNSSGSSSAGGSGGGSASTTTSSSSSSGAGTGSNKINGFAGSLLNGTKKESSLKTFGPSTSGGTTQGSSSMVTSTGGVASSQTKYEMLRNNFFGSGITRERDPKLNSSCQALNLCANNGGSNGGPSNGNASSIYGASSINSTASNNNDSLINGLTGPASSKVSSRAAGGTRVRRTISCYAKNPSKLDSLENNLSQQAAGFGLVEKDMYLGSSMMNMSSTSNANNLHHHHHHIPNGHHHHGPVNGYIAAATSAVGINGHVGGGGLGASTASIVHYQPQQHAAQGAMNGHHHHLSSAANAPGVGGGASFPNPICEFSPFSSMSSTDLIGLRMTNGFGAGGLERRYVGSNGSANFTTYFHDNPIDCGCSTCFQVKLNIFQVCLTKKFSEINYVLAYTLSAFV